MMLNGCKLMKEHETEMGIHSEGLVGRVWGERVAISSWMVKERLREGDAAGKGCRESQNLRTRGKCRTLKPGVGDAGLAVEQHRGQGCGWVDKRQVGRLGRLPWAGQQLQSFS